MELTEKLKELLDAYQLASITDFVDEDEIDFYLEETDFDKEKLKVITRDYSGEGMDSLNDSIINELKKYK